MNGRSSDFRDELFKLVSGLDSDGLHGLTIGEMMRAFLGGMLCVAFVAGVIWLGYGIGLSPETEALVGGPW